MYSTRVVVVLLLPVLCQGARILVLQPTPARGHTIVTEPLYEELASRGHRLTVVTSYPHDPPLPNLEEIDVSEDTQARIFLGNCSLDFIKDNMPTQFHSPWFMTHHDHEMCKRIYSNARVKKLLKFNENFDMVITEIFTNDCFTPVARKFNAPLVSVVTSCSLPWMSDRAGLPDNPAYIPNYFVDVGNEMSFIERVYNTLFLVYTKLLYLFVIGPRTQSLVDEYLDDAVPPIRDIIRNTSLILVNSYFSLTYSRPFPPNVIEVGGIHIRNTTSVPQDLQDILDTSSQGVLVVSFGSMVRVSSLPKPVIRSLLTSFSKIPQTVIFKYEEELLDIPKNVIVRKWLPQRDITGHKNVKALLVHGGLASTTEAVYFGKPVIGVPFFSDQFLNIKTITRHGAGVLLNLDDITEQSLDSALQRVLNDPKFTEKARQLSERFRDRPMTPLQTAVYWVEYVLRHRGAPQLRPASVDLGLGQYLLLDILAVLLSTSLVLVICVYCILRRLYRTLCRSSVVPSVKKKN